MDESNGTSNLSEQLRRYHEKLDVDLGWTIVSGISASIDLFIAGRVPPGDVGEVREATLVEIAFNLSKIRRGADENQIWQWCYTIARRQIAQYFKGRKRAPVVVAPETLEALSDAAGDYAFENEIYIKEALEILKSALPECFGLLWDRYVVGMAVSELASQLDCQEDAMRKRITRCRGDAREVLMEGGAYGE